MEIGIGGAILALVAFVSGKLLSQSEAVLENKKKAYSDFLKACATASDAYNQNSSERVSGLMEKLSTEIGLMSLYASPSVVLLAGQYFEKLNDAFEHISEESEALHPSFIAATKAYNTMILEMRRDTLGWSLFGIWEWAFGSNKARQILKDSQK